MRTALLISTLVAAASTATAKVYFHETFDSGNMDRWTPSKHREEYGQFQVSPGKWFAHPDASKGLRTTEDNKHYSISAKFDEDFDNTDKDLVVQFSVKHEQNIDCGGGYLKITAPGLDQEMFNGDSPYQIMFGPDICGATRRVHVIFSYKGENKLIKKDISCPTDQLTHLYTLIVKPDQTYKVLIDQKEAASGSLLEDWDFLPPKTIKDPDATKPDDWVDDAMIPDPEDKKPEGYDDVPEYIPDPDSVKPEDWNDEEDGEWKQLMKENPDFIGEWMPKMIKNEAYKGPWVHPEIPNPDYIVDDKIYARNSGYVGIEIWQVKSGTIFDNFLVTDSAEEAEKAANEEWAAHKENEEKAKSAVDEEDMKAEKDMAEKLEEAKQREADKEKIEEVMAAEELAAVEEDEPLSEMFEDKIVPEGANTKADVGGGKTDTIFKDEL